MGNIGRRMSSKSPVAETPKPVKIYDPVDTFQFMDPLPEDTNNGLYLNDFYFPEEILMMILSYVSPKDLLKLSEVCKKWCNIIKSDAFWADIYHREYHKKPKKLPWYVYYTLLSTNYFDTNLIKNGNGQDQYNHWNIIFNYGDQFRIEDPPCGADPLPVDVPEFNNKTSCFATSYYECNKLQEIIIESRLMQLILSRYKPHIYLSEWMAARFDCGCIYNLSCKLYGDRKVISKGKPGRKESESEEDDDDFFDEEDDRDEIPPLHVEQVSKSVEQWAGSTWTKVELLVSNYPSGVRRIVFQHEGRDTQFWKGHYGSKMAGGVLRILFDTIEPVPA